MTNKHKKSIIQLCYFYLQVDMEKTKIINTMTNLETNYLVYIDRKRLSDDDFNKVKLHDLFNSYEIELAKKL